MRSEAAATASARGAAPEIVGELARRTAGLQAGDACDVSDLEAADPFGPGDFAALAARFGLERVQDGAWRIKRAPRWQPGWLDHAHEAQFLDLFEAAFGYRMDPRLWHWKYDSVPRPGMGVWRDAKLLAFFGALPREVLLFGQSQSCVQIADVMVHPLERGVMTRSGALLVSAASYIERSVGYGRPHLFGFGFPTGKHLALAQKLGLYEPVDTMRELTWTSGEQWSGRMVSTRAVTAADASAIDRLWQAMAKDFKGDILGVRDFAFVERRFLRHPTVEYTCLLVRRRFTGRAIGMVALRMVDGQTAELMDLIAPRGAFATLVGVARGWAAERGAAKLRAWVTTSHEPLLAATKPQVTPMDLAVPANVWTRGPAPAELRGKWWLMAGDTDFR
jgi:hypothetical protein